MGSFFHSVATAALDVTYLLRSRAPTKVIITYLRDLWRAKFLAEKYKGARGAFQSVAEELEFTSDWFSAHIPFWCWVFDEYELHGKEIEALEIGSYEGRSSVFLLDTLDRATITCVDAWDCTVYRLRGRDCNQTAMIAAEARFDRNMASFGGRFRKNKSTSIAFFGRAIGVSQFDFIYVDGPHFCDDVLVDTVIALDLLKVGGIIVFDDYLWRRYSRVQDNPAAAINSVLRLKKGSYNIVCAHHQLVLQKTADAVSAL